MILKLDKPYLVYVNGVLAQRTLTRAKAIKIAMEYFPSYVYDSKKNTVTWTGGK